MSNKPSAQGRDYAAAFTQMGIPVLSNSEQIRMRHCLGCKYMVTCAYYGCCNYYLTTGKRRPCKFGQKCPVKALLPKFTLPDWYDAWCAEWDAKIEKKRANAARRQAEREAAIRALLTEAQELSKQHEEIPRQDTSAPIAEQSCDSESFQYRLPRTIKYKSAPSDCTRRYKTVWDVDYAFSLFYSGYYICDIEDIMGLDGKQLRSYIERHKWRDVPGRATVYRRADVKAERQRYLTWKRNREVETKRKNQQSNNTRKLKPE